MNWKLALKKRWLELLIALIWMAGAVLNGIRGYQINDWCHWVVSVCAFICAILWGFIFYKRAKRDGA